MSKALTVKSIEAVRAGDKRLELPDGHTRGLFLVVQPSGVKSWALRYRFGGRPRKLTIGPLLLSRDATIGGPRPLGSPQTLAEARTAAQTAKLAIASGNDPGAAKTAERTSPADPEENLVRKHASRFVEQYCKPKNRSWRETERQFKTTILPVIGAKRIAEVTKVDVVRIRDGLVEAGTPIMANRVFATLRKFFNWLVGRGALEKSPCSGLSMPSAETSRDRVLSWTEVDTLWRETFSLSEPFGALIRTLVLSGQRREEVAGLNDSEIDRARMTWTIPAVRAKNGKTHIVPITDTYVATVDRVKRIGEKGLVFSTTGETPVSGFSKAKARLDELLKFDLSWTLHDLRRTVATGMAELGEPIHVVEAVLNHKSGSIKGVAAVYNRHDYFEEKARAITAWCRFIEDVITDEAVRLAYSLMRDRRALITAIHGDERRWRRYLSILKQLTVVREAAA
jgi:integrase